MRRAFISLMAISISFFSASIYVALADTILDDFQVNTEFPGHPPQDSPYSVANWQTQRIHTTFLSQHDGTNWDVALARHNYNLQPVGQTTYLNVREGTYNCLRPKLVIRSTGVGAAWIEARSPNHIMFRSLDGNGNPTCPPVRMEDDFSNVLRDYLSIAALYDGFLLVWYDGRDSSKIWAQKVNLSGQLIGPNSPIQPDSTGSILGLEAQTHPDGRVLVSWVTNNQYSRGRWLDSLGNFMGEVFEMAEAWVDEEILYSLVRFSPGGTGLLYQYSDSSAYTGLQYEEYVYNTYLDSMALALGSRELSGIWYIDYDDGFAWHITIKYYPDLLYMVSGGWCSVVYEHSLGGDLLGGYSNNYYNVLYSSISDTSIIPWGAGETFKLNPLNADHLLFAADINSVGLREFEAATLELVEPLVWINEPGFSNSQGRSDICVHEDGDFRIIFNNYFEIGSYVYTRYHDSAGMPEAADTIVSMTPELNPAVSYGGRMELTDADQSLVIWTGVAAPIIHRVLGTTFARNLWSNEVHLFSTSQPVMSGLIPAFDVNNVNRLLMVWEFIGDYDDPIVMFRGQTFDNLFNFYQSSFNIFQLYPGNMLIYCDTALRNDGRFLICWKDWEDGSESWTQFRAGINYNQLLSPPVGIHYDEEGFVAVENGAANYLLAWTDPTAMYFQQVDTAGNLIGEAQVISEANASPQGEPDMAVSSNYNFAVCWQDARNDSGDIYCRQFNPDGSFFGNEYRVNSDPVGVMQKEPAIAFGPEDRLYFTWTDFRNPGGQGDIYCKVIEWEDALDAPVYQPPLPRAFALHPPSPNPFNGATAIRYQLPANSFVSLRIYDTTGRLVSILADGQQTAGSHQVLFDGSDLASGIYIARLQAGDFVGVEKLVLLK